MSVAAPATDAPIVARALSHQQVLYVYVFFFQAEDGIRDLTVTGVQTCALPISNGEGGFPHLAFEHLRLMGGFSFTHVPYKGSAAIATDVIGGQVHAAIDGITGLTPHIRSGRLRLLAITNRTRVALWPDTPAAAETVHGYESGGWFGYVAPAGTPRAIVLKLNEEINRAMKLPDVNDKLVTAGLIVVAQSPEYFGEGIRSDYAKDRKLVLDIRIQPQ